MKTYPAVDKVSYVKTIAASMVLLAVKNEKFRVSMCRYLFNRELLVPYPQENELSVDLSSFFANTQPISEIVADRKLEWLVNELNYIDSDDRCDTLRVLGLATLSIPDPKAAAWGILFNQTLGLTRGNPDFSSGLEYSQEIILNQDWEDFNKLELAQAISAASAGVLSKCLEVADYDFKRLEPEVVSWLSESRTSLLYSVSSNSEFNEVVSRAYLSGISFFVSADGALPNIIALQPSIAGSHYKIVEGLALLR